MDNGNPPGLGGKKNFNLCSKIELHGFSQGFAVGEARLKEYFGF